MMQHMEVKFRYHVDIEILVYLQFVKMKKYYFIGNCCQACVRRRAGLPIVELWVVIHGYAYTSGWMEQHKQINKKMVQKSKGVRKKIN